MSGRIRAAPTLKRFLCFVLIDVKCFRLPPKMSLISGGRLENVGASMPHKTIGLHSLRLPFFYLCCFKWILCLLRKQLFGFPTRVDRRSHCNSYCSYVLEGWNLSCFFFSFLHKITFHTPFIFHNQTFYSDHSMLSETEIAFHWQ
jgi:hypothetical protein